MSAVRLQVFGGMVPRTARHLLQDTQAQVATNARLTSGSLAAVREPYLQTAPDVDGIQTIHKITSGGSNYWLAWDVDVDVVRGPVAGDTTFRTYFTGDNEPRVTNLSLATSSTPYPKQFYVLGVYPPQTAPDVTHAGGTGTAVSRSFVYTFVTQWGEESAPSPATTITVGKTDGTWTIGAVTPLETPPANTFTTTAGSWAGGTATLTVASTRGLRVGEEISVSGVTPSGYNTASAVITALTSTQLSYAVTSNPGAYTAAGTVARIALHNTTSMTKRIYWTETTEAGTTYQFVAEVSGATTNTTVAGSTTAGEELETTTWEQPPVDLRGLCLHPSGALVGFSKNEVCFSEPLAPYAWPDEYRITLNYTVVGTGVFGTNVLAATTGTPFLITGTAPEAMTSTKIDQPWPCLAKRGLVSLGYGVAYPSTEGVVLVGTEGASLLTKDLYAIDEWRLLTPSSFIAAPYAGRYVVSYDAGSGTRRMIIIDKTEFASVTTADHSISALYADAGDGKLYVVIDDAIYEWDSASGAFLTYDWMSKEFILPKPMNLAAARVDADFNLTSAENAAVTAARAAVQAANQALITAETYEAGLAESDIGDVDIGNTDLEDLPALADQCQFQLWVNNALKFSKTLTSSASFTLPSGYRADRVAVRVSGNVRVFGVVLGNSMKDLERA